MRYIKDGKWKLHTYKKNFDPLIIYEYVNKMIVTSVFCIFSFVYENKFDSEIEKGKQKTLNKSISRFIKLKEILWAMFISKLQFFV